MISRNDIFRLAVAACVSLAAGCASTVTPDPVRDLAPSYDSTTPPQYPNDSSGVLDLIKNDRGEVVGALITAMARERYNSLIKAYRLQFRERHHVLLHPDDGVKTTRDKYGNAVWIMDADHLEDFILLNGWAKDDVPPDSVWQKVKASVTE
jgi:hypothetical protein